MQCRVFADEQWDSEGSFAGFDTGLEIFRWQLFRGDFVADGGCKLSHNADEMWDGVLSGHFATAEALCPNDNR